MCLFNFHVQLYLVSDNANANTTQTYAKEIKQAGNMWL